MLAYLSQPTLAATRVSSAARPRTSSFCPMHRPFVLHSGASLFISTVPSWRPKSRSTSRIAPEFPQAPPSVRQPPAAVFSGGGFLGVGPAEIAVILVVGWFVLGPEKLYDLSKDVGRVIGDLRRTANDARDNFQEALDLEMPDVPSSSTSEVPATLRPDEPPSPASSPKPEPNSESSEDSAQLEADLVAQHAQHDSSADANEEDAVTSGPVDQLVDPDVANAAFLDQLKRVADPNQKPLSPEQADVPDLDVQLDADELEVQRLEKQYLEARARLDTQRKDAASAAAAAASSSQPAPSKKPSSPSPAEGSDPDAS